MPITTTATTKVTATTLPMIVAIPVVSSLISITSIRKNIWNCTLKISCGDTGHPHAY